MTSGTKGVRNNAPTIKYLSWLFDIGKSIADMNNKMDSVEKIAYF